MSRSSGVWRLVAMVAILALGLAGLHYLRPFFRRARPIPRALVGGSLMGVSFVLYVYFVADKSVGYSLMAGCASAILFGTLFGPAGLRAEEASAGSVET